VNDWLNELLKDYGPAIGRWAGFLILLLATPLLVLAWWKKIYPHTPLVIALLVPSLLSLLLVAQPRLLPVIVIIDAVILIVAIGDLVTLPWKKSFSGEREATRVVSVQKKHPVTLHISNLGFRQRIGWVRDESP